jgi:hypothetical protein
MLVSGAILGWSLGHGNNHRALFATGAIAAASLLSACVTATPPEMAWLRTDGRKIGDDPGLLRALRRPQLAAARRGGRQPRPMPKAAIFYSAAVTLVEWSLSHQRATSWGQSRLHRRRTNERVSTQPVDTGRQTVTSSDVIVDTVSRKPPFQQTTLAGNLE